MEERVAADLKKRGIKAEYEPFKVKYTQPAKTRSYTPDFVINGKYIEVKGRLTSEDRSKYKWFKESTGIQLYFVFQRPSNPIYKGSKTTYAKWAEDNGFAWAERTVPDVWLD